MNLQLKQKEQLSIQGKAMAVTAILVTSVFWSQGTDPFNLPKLFLLVMGALIVLGSIAFSSKKVSNKSLINLRSLVFLSLILGLSISYFFSGAPSSQMIYGVYGRNTGLLCYLSLAIVYLVGSRFENLADATWALKSLVVSFVFVSAVCFIELAGLNPQGINESVKMSLIGTFGNSNFVSAFMGMAGIVFFTLSLAKGLNIKKRLALFLMIGVSAYLILKTDSRQGLVVLLGGCLFILGIYIYKNFNSKKLKVSYLLLFLTGAALSVAGLMRMGPLADLIYKNSVGFRFEYWKAGTEMFLANPITGVGLNSYGDWYRFFRSEMSLISPGVDVFTNTAHNVYIDLAATGGIFLFASYVLVIVLALKSVLRFMLRNQEFDVVFYSLFGAWLVYLTQASISIDQIGLAIWGWLLPGVICSYDKMNESKFESDANQGRKKSLSGSQSSATPPQAVIGATLGFILGILILSPALKADFDLRKAYGSTSAQLLINAANQFPLDSNKSASIASALLNNNLLIESLEIARSGVARNPMTFDLWKLIYLNPQAGIEERREALAKMQFIDPRNDRLDTLKLRA